MSLRTRSSWLVAPSALLLFTACPADEEQGVRSLGQGGEDDSAIAHLGDLESPHDRLGRGVDVGPAPHFWGGFHPHDGKHSGFDDDAGTEYDAATKHDGGTEPHCLMSHPCEGGIEIPADQHYVAPGLCARAVAVTQDKLRQITFAPNGDLFAVTTAGAIRRYRDVDCDGMFDSEPPERVLWASTGGNGNNVHIDADEGFLYAGVWNGVMRWRYDPTLDVGVDPERVVVGHPSSGNHTYATVHVYDGFLYVHSGSEGNVSDPMSPEYDTNRSLLKRFALADFDAQAPFDWSEGEVFALGLRNMVGYTQHPSGELYGVVNGIDDLHYQGVDIHDQNPAELVVRVTEGSAFGYPYCFHALQVERPDGRLFPRGTPLHTELAPAEGFVNPHDDAWCKQNTDKPVALLDAHSAPLDIAFFAQPSQALPKDYIHGAFVSLHGSWNRGDSTGHKVVWLPMTKDGIAWKLAAKSPKGGSDYPVIFGGGTSSDAAVKSGARSGSPVDGAWGWSVDGIGEDLVRPVGVAVSPVDGALYISSDNGKVLGTDGPGQDQGALYRIARY